MKALRTPDERFTNLPGYPFKPNYVFVDDTDNGPLRMHYVDEGPRDAAPVLMLHGEPSWSYLYRKMIPVFVEAGYRAIAPDLIGFGRSDKPTKQGDYTHARHVEWTGKLVRQLDLRNITLVCQDWGGLIGLRLITEEGARFGRVVAANTILPGFPMNAPELKGVFGMGRFIKTIAAFGAWYAFSQLNPSWKAGTVVGLGVARKMLPEIRAAYDAPFPSSAYMAGARVFPRLVPKDRPANRKAWEQLMRWEKPFLCAFSDKDPIMREMAGIIPALIPGAKGQPHTTIRDAGHFLQEDNGEELADVIVEFLRRR